MKRMALIVDGDEQWQRELEKYLVPHDITPIQAVTARKAEFLFKKYRENIFVIAVGNTLIEESRGQTSTLTKRLRQQHKFDGIMIAVSEDPGHDERLIVSGCRYTLSKK